MIFFGFRLGYRYKIETNKLAKDRELGKARIVSTEVDRVESCDAFLPSLNLIELRLDSLEFYRVLGTFNQLLEIIDTHE